MHSRRMPIKKRLVLSTIADSVVVKDFVRSYNDASSSSERRRLLSTLSQHFSRDGLNKMLDFKEKISRRQFHEAGGHAIGHGNGAMPFRTEIHTTRVPAGHFEEIMRLMHREDSIQSLATGHNSMRLSDGTQISVLAVKKKVAKGHMYDVYSNRKGMSKTLLPGI